MNWVQLGGSIVAILVLAGIAAALKLGGIAPIADEQAAAVIAETDLSGFAAAGAWLGTDGCGAVVIGQDDSVALIKPHGAHYAVRRVFHPTVRPAASGAQYQSSIAIDSGDRLWGALRITLANPDEARGLADALAKAAVAPQLTSV